MKPGRIVLVLMFAFVAAVLPLSAYVAAYLSLAEYADYRGNTAEGEPTNQIVRDFGQREWALMVFQPAAAVESHWIGVPVYLAYLRDPLVVYDTGGAGEPVPVVESAK